MIYAVVSLRHGDHFFQRIIRWDPSTGDVVRSDPFHGGGSLVLAGGSVWASGRAPWDSPQSKTFARTLYRFDPKTLELQDRVRLSSSGGALAGSPAGLWAGAGRYLYRLDPATGRVLSSIEVRGKITQISVDPFGRFLYLAAWRLRYGDGSLEERDARTGTLMKRAQPLLAYPATDIAPTGAGVWVSTPTGNFGGVFFYRQIDLGLKARMVEGSHWVTANVAAGRLWVSDVFTGLHERLTCIDPEDLSHERVIRMPQRWRHGYNALSNVVRVHGTMYVGTTAGIVRFSLSSCG